MANNAAETDGLAPIPWCHWLWDGPPCVNKNQANIQRGKHRDCVKTECESTGEGFILVLRYTEASRPEMVTLERYTLEKLSSPMVELTMND